jgi:regulatory protein
MCSFEVLEKMRKWGLNSSDREKVLNGLIDRRFVDDRRFAHAFVHSKFAYNRWGVKKIRLSLATKRIDRELVDEAIDEVIEPEIYEDVLRKLIKARAREMTRPISHEDKMKLCRFAMQRGFEWEYVSRAVSTISKANPDDYED